MTLNPHGPTPRYEFPTWLEPYRAPILDELRNSLYNRQLNGLSEGVEYQLESGGKRLRPALILWLGERLGADRARLLPFAMAVELLHNFFLIHDDIEDGDRFRRNRATLWVHFGIGKALNVADYLLVEAFQRSRESGEELLEILLETFRTTVEGQALDLRWRADATFHLEAYEEIIRKKTGRYLACGWVGAALLAGHRPEEAAGFWAVGAQLGPAFQIKDDLLDLTDGKGRGGEQGCDIREGKPSILFAHTLGSHQVSESDKKQLVAILAKAREQTSDDEVQWVRELYQRSGAGQFAEREMRRRVEFAVQELASLIFLPEAAVQEFHELAAYMIERRA